MPVALGRTKIGRRQQASGANTVAEPEEPDQELESYLAALSPEEDMQTTGSGRAFGSSEVFQLRLPLMANERLKEIAAQQGLSPAALAKDWIMQHLSLDPEPTPNPNPAPNAAPNANPGADANPGPNGGPVPDNHIGFPMSGPEDRYSDCGCRQPVASPPRASRARAAVSVRAVMRDLLSRSGVGRLRGG